MMWWRKTRTEPGDTPPDPNLPLIHLEGVTKVFKGDADEETRALDDVTADISRSKLAPNYQLQSATLQFAVAGDIVTATSRVVLASGQQSQATERFQVDGQGHPFEKSPLGPGVVVVARWLGPRVLETVAAQNGKEVARATYEVSPDGRTLTATTSGMVQQVIVFERK